MIHGSEHLTSPVRWVTGVLERSRDLVVLGGGMIGLALIVGIIVVGVHERHSSFRSSTPASYAQESPSR
jgi:hypothetical protein